MSLVAVLVASVLGSVHCAAMCGGFATVAAGAPGRRGAWRATAAYQGGRLLAYLGLGVAAGVLGAGLDAAGGALLGLRRGAALLTGLALVLMALAALWPRRTASGVGGPTRLVTLGSSPSRTPWLRRWLLAPLRRGGPWAAGLVGLGSALLPCGWLWSYVLVAAATGAAPSGAAVMLAFWAGGLPVLLSVGVVAGWLRPRVGRHAPRLVAAIMLLLGGLALAGKLGPAMPEAATEGEATTSTEAATPPPCHGSHGAHSP